MMMLRACIAYALVLPASGLLIGARTTQPIKSPMMSAKKPLRLSPDEIDPAIPELLAIGQSHFISQTLYAMVKLGVPDAIGADTMTPEEIAKALPGKPNVDMLGRGLRLLSVATGLFIEEATKDDDDKASYSLSTTGALLQTKVEGQPSMACGMLHWLEKPYWDAWAALPDYIAGESKEVPYKAATGDMVFDYYAKHPESAEPFNEFMSFFSMGEIPVVVEIFDWSPYDGKKVVDLGGSYGPVMGALKQKMPGITTVSFDLPEVIEAAGKGPPGVELVGGSFFDGSTIPKTDGALFMKHVRALRLVPALPATSPLRRCSPPTKSSGLPRQTLLDRRSLSPAQILHDWSDDDCLKILAACKEALEPGGKVIVADAVLDAPGKDSPLKVPQTQLDMLMGVIGGKERTLKQWEDLAAGAGFEVEQLTDSPSPACQLLTLTPK